MVSLVLGGGGTSTLESLIPSVNTPLEEYPKNVETS